MTVAALLSAISCTTAEQKLNKFQEEVKAGNLTSAEQIITTIDKRSLKEQAAIELIRTYLSVDQIDRAISVYENITPRHRGRHELSDYFTKSNDYDCVVCRMLRTALINHGDYDLAWLYYPLKYRVEDDYRNSEPRFQYLVDVVNDMCLKGRYDAARNFANVQAAWFAVHVDNIVNAKEPESVFTSDYVRQCLYEQINHLSY